MSDSAEPERGPADHQRVRDAGDHRRIGHHVRAADVPGPPGQLRRGGRGARQVLEHVAPVDRRRAVPAPGRQRHHRHALDQPDEEAERARARADDDRGAQRDPLRHGAEQRALDREPRAEVARQRRVRPGPARRGRRRAAGRRRRRPRRTPRRSAARRRRTRRRPRPPSSGSGSTRRRRRRARAPAPRRSSRRRARGRRARRRPPLTRSRERAKPRTAWPSRRRRSTSAAPT